MNLKLKEKVKKEEKSKLQVKTCDNTYFRSHGHSAVSSFSLPRAETIGYSF